MQRQPLKVFCSKTPLMKQVQIGLLRLKRFMIFPRSCRTPLIQPTLARHLPNPRYHAFMLPTLTRHRYHSHQGISNVCTPSTLTVLAHMTRQHATHTSTYSTPFLKYTLPACQFISSYVNFPLNVLDSQLVNQSLTCLISTSVGQLVNSSTSLYANW